MKKIIFTIFIISNIATYSFAQTEQTADNVGYTKSHGMVAGYMILPDYNSRSFKDTQPSGGGMFYLNVFNEIWGNVAIGLSTDYSSPDTYVENHEFSYTVDMSIIPITFNIAYMTASDFLNAWAGIGISYVYYDMQVQNGSYSDTVVYGTQDRITVGTIGADVFIGGEYLFTDSGKLGVFFEFRYSIVDAIYISQDLKGTDMNLTQSLNLDRFKSTLGVSFHF